MSNDNDCILNEENFDPLWLVREFDEFDEKIPLIVARIFEQNIDFRDDFTSHNSILKIMRDTLHCYLEMTGDEIAYYFDSILIGCEIKQCVDDGMLNESDGKITLNNKNRDE